MSTHRNASIINDWRRPSGGLCTMVDGLEIDWEPGDPPIEYDPRLERYWIAIKRHMARPKPPVDFIRLRAGPARAT